MHRELRKLLKVTQLLSSEPKFKPKAWSNMQIVFCNLPKCFCFY